MPQPRGRLAEMSYRRPFMEWPLEQLAEHARNHAGHIEVLERVHHELSCRAGREARALQRQLDAQLPRAMPRWESSSSADQADAALRRRLAAATQEVQVLRERLAASGGHDPAASASPHAALWLQPGAPEWLVLAARRAFRRHYHPDRHAGIEREAAEIRFKEAEEAFSKILGAGK